MKQVINKNMRVLKFALMTIISNGLAVMAYAQTGTTINTQCANGTTYPVTVYCGSGQTAYAGCNCSSWSSGSGYSNCGSTWSVCLGC
jgi:hypothetical protein